MQVLLRLASDRFKLQLRWLLGSSRQPRVLSSLFSNHDSQFHLLFCQYDHSFPLDTYHVDDNRVFVEVQFDAPEGGCGDQTGRQWSGMLAKLGFEMIRGEDGAWLFDSIIWHDFRDGFRPGLVGRAHVAARGIRSTGRVEVMLGWQGCRCGSRAPTETRRVCG